MTLVIVPDSVAAAINAALDAALADHPDAAPDRDRLYHQLLDYVDQHGVIPSFSLAKRTE